jgi:hypothetical protein
MYDDIIGDFPLPGMSVSVAFKILNIEQILPGIFCHIYYIALQNFFVNEKKTDVKIFIAVHLFF